MKANYLLLGLLFGLNITYAQIDSSLVSFYDSAFNHFVFKPEINTTVTELVAQKSTTVFKISNNDALVLNREKTDEIGMKVYRYNQFYKNIKVEDSQFYIHANDKDIPISANGELSYNININTTPTITSEQAINLAINHANATQYFWEDTMRENSIKERKNNPDASYYPTAELVIINLNASQKSILPNYILAYKVPIYSLAPFDAYFLFIDANSGNIVLSKQIMVSCTSEHNSIPNNAKSDIKSQKSKYLKTFNNSQKQSYFNADEVFKHKVQQNSFSNSQLSNINVNTPPSSLSCSGACNQGIAYTLYYGTQYIQTDKVWHNVNCTYRTKNSCTGTYLYVVKCNNNDYYDDTNNWDDSNDDVGTTALWCLERTHDFFRSAPYYRNSYDGNYSQVKLFTKTSYVNGLIFCDGPGQGAYWLDNELLIGNGTGSGDFNKNLTTLDIIGHEFTHGVNDSEANLTYQGESGALDESFADIFGTMIDFYGKTYFTTPLQPNYTLGEECTTAGKLRDMTNPNSMNHPDTYSGSYWANTSSSTDYGGVHTNSGVQNFWFYLLSEGGSETNDIGNQYCVQKIERDKAARIAYRALTVHLTPNSQYADSRYWTIESAKELYGSSSNEVAQVTNAWYAVGVGSAFNGTIEINNHTVSGTEVINRNNDVVFNNLQVPSGTSLTVTSSSKISMKSTSKASSGSYFHAYITSGCTGSSSIPLSDNFTNEENLFKNTKIEAPNTDTVQFNNTDIFSIAAYPNPFNNTTTLEYNVPYNCIVNISIYNIYGTKIQELVNLSHSKGEYTLELNLSNNSNAVYYCKLKSENESKTIKIVKN